MGARTRAALAARVVALLAGCGLAGCGGSKGATPGTATTAAGAAGKGSGLPVWDENRKMNDPTGYTSPLASALGYGGQLDQAAEQAKYKEREQKRQEAAAECMRAEGFTYTPYVPSDAMVSFTPPGFELTRREFVEKYGFGISTMTEEMNRPPENAPKAEDDPNFTYLQSLPPSEQEAYQKALYGNEITQGPATDGPASTEGDAGDESTASTVGGFQMGGCMGKAEESLNGGPANEADRAFADEFQKRLETLYEKVQSDRRVVDANRAYATCMAGKGFPEIDKQQAAYEKVSEKMQPLYESMNGGTSGGFVTGAVGAPATAVVAVPSGGDGTGGPTFDPVKLAEVKTYELAVAKADLACGKDVMKASYEVSVELEQAFVDENAADLARYKDVSGRVGGMGG